MVCLLAALHVTCHCAKSSCQPAATCENVKCRWSQVMLSVLSKSSCIHLFYHTEQNLWGTRSAETRNTIFDGSRNQNIISDKLSLRIGNAERWLPCSDVNKAWTHRDLTYDLQGSVADRWVYNSHHSNGHFPGGPGLASTRMYPFWILLELRVMEVVVTTAAIRRVKLQSNSHHQQTNTQFFTGWMPILSPNQKCQSTEGKWVYNYKKFCIYALSLLVFEYTTKEVIKHKYKTAFQSTMTMRKTIK